MFRLAALALLIAAPGTASAQFASGACQPHLQNQVRCALRLTMPAGNRLHDVSITASRHGAEARMQTDTYVSHCGSDGRMIGRGNIANSGTSRVAQITHEHAPALSGVCVEVFLLNCVAAGVAASCQRVVHLPASRVEIR